MKHFLALLCLVFASASFAATPVSISLNPSTGVAPYASTLTWSAPGAASCTASGAWTGTKAATGTQSVTVANATPYKLDCSYADGSITLTWTLPTANTDGTALTDLAGINVFRGTTATNLVKIKGASPAPLNYVDSGLATGSYYYAVTAYNTAQGESVRTQSVPYPVQVTGTTASASAVPGVQSIPNPPTGVIVTTTNVSVNVQTTTGISAPQ